MKLNFSTKTEEQMRTDAANFYSQIKTRRSVREFKATPVPDEIIEYCLLAAGTAPNGANLQPWHFCVVKSPQVKAEMRTAAEQHEHKFYNGGAPEEWIDALKHLNTNESKPFLETAPILIAIFQKSTTFDHEGIERKCYYAKESVGIATGMLITALHQSGLATLTHTPSPMNFLNKILDRPSSEKTFLLLVVGYPTDDCEVPNIEKHTIDTIRTYH
ncbi:MAG: nitroreductase family protein [Akkermansiaceae bacterium]